MSDDLKDGGVTDGGEGRWEDEKEMQINQKGRTPSK